MKLWFYYTLPNGDILCQPNHGSLGENLKILGDVGAHSFSVQEGCGVNPIFDGEKYISDPIAINKSEKQKANDLYNSIENHFLIEANNRVYNFNISKKLDFFAKFMMQGEADFLDWDDYSNETVQHNKQGTTAIIQSADIFLRALFNAKKADKLACESGDYSLTNLTAIKAQQDALRGGE